MCITSVFYLTLHYDAQKHKIKISKVLYLLTRHSCNNWHVMFWVCGCLLTTNACRLLWNHFLLILLLAMHIHKCFHYIPHTPHAAGHKWKYIKVLWLMARHSYGFSYTYRSLQWCWWKQACTVILDKDTTFTTKFR